MIHNRVGILFDQLNELPEMAVLSDTYQSNIRKYIIRFKILLISKVMQNAVGPASPGPIRRIKKRCTL